MYSHVCFPSEFHSGFFSTLRRSFGTKRILANTVYCEYIKERDHIHMNATRWVALAGYVRWLGSQGKWMNGCIIDSIDPLLFRLFKNFAKSNKQKKAGILH
jgi:hypothetical protein